MTAPGEDPYLEPARAYCRVRFDYNPVDYVAGEAGAAAHLERDARDHTEVPSFRAVVDTCRAAELAARAALAVAWDVIDAAGKVSALLDAVCPIHGNPERGPWIAGEPGCPGCRLVFYGRDLHTTLAQYRRTVPPAQRRPAALPDGKPMPTA